MHIKIALSLCLASIKINILKSHDFYIYKLIHENMNALIKIYIFI